MKLFTSLSLTVAALVTAITPSIPVSAVSHARIANLCERASLIGHRGEPGFRGGVHYDENTIESFQSARRHGADEVETDLRLTKDGVWVLMHDATVDRTTNGHGTVRSLTYDQISKLKTTHGAKVPSVDTLLSTFAGTTVNFQLELKGFNLNQKRVEELVAMVNTYNLHDRVSFTSSQGANLLQIKGIDPTLQTGFIGSGTSKPTIKTLKKFKVDFVTVDYRVITKSYVQSLHDHGFIVGARSAAQDAQYKRILVDGVDRVVTDYTNRYTNWCSAL